MNNVSVTAVRLPNGKLKVIKNSSGQVDNKEYISESEIYSNYQKLNEGVQPSVQILEMLNE